MKQMKQYELMRVEDPNAEGTWCGNRKLFPHLDMTTYMMASDAIDVARGFNANRRCAQDDFLVVFCDDKPYWSPSEGELRQARQEALQI